jgi:hypothetical protein
MGTSSTAQFLQHSLHGSIVLFHLRDVPFPVSRLQISGGTDFAAQTCQEKLFANIH